jgi:hypothetical protein
MDLYTYLGDLYPQKCYLLILPFYCEILAFNDYTPHCYCKIPQLELDAYNILAK